MGRDTHRIVARVSDRRVLVLGAASLARNRLDRELEARIEELKRRDLVVAQMNATISELARPLPELYAPSEPSESSESASETPGRSASPPAPEEKRSWLGRFFGL